MLVGDVARYLVVYLLAFGGFALGVCLVYQRGPDPAAARGDDRAGGALTHMALVSLGDSLGGVVGQYGAARSPALALGLYAVWVVLSLVLMLNLLGAVPCALRARARALERACVRACVPSCACCISSHGPHRASPCTSFAVLGVCGGGGCVRARVRCPSHRTAWALSRVLTLILPGQHRACPACASVRVRAAGRPDPFRRTAGAAVSRVLAHPHAHRFAYPPLDERPGYARSVTGPLMPSPAGLWASSRVPRTAPAPF